MFFTTGKPITALSVFFLVTSITFSQQLNTEKYQFLSPKPGSENNTQSTVIVIREGSRISKPSSESFELIGSINGYYHFELSLANDGKTINLKPAKPFVSGETITVTSVQSIHDTQGRILPELHFDFSIRSIDPPERGISLNSNFNLPGGSSVFLPSTDTNYIAGELPVGMPELIMMEKNDPAEGCYFFAPLLDPGISYLIIVDNNLRPIFYRDPYTLNYRDFKVLPDGTLTYYDHGRDKYYIMDSTYHTIDSVWTIGYDDTDEHEMILLDNGNYMLYGFYEYTTDLSAYGGSSNALILSQAIQEIDASKNVVFEWRYPDYIHESDYSGGLGQNTIDVYHANSIDVDTDGNLVSSARNLDEITKINRSTGEIMWRLGGKGNQFEYINSDSLPFSHQHDIRVIGENRYSLFDNDWQNGVSSSLDFEIDTVNMTYTRSWEYFKNNQFGVAFGSYRNFGTDGRIISWGYITNPAVSITELKGDNGVAMDFAIQQISVYPDRTLTFYLCTYRAFKYPWRNTVFDADRSTILFDSTHVDDSLTQQITIKSTYDKTIDINSFYCTDTSFEITTPLPVTLNPGDSAQFQIKFKPQYAADFVDTLYFQSFYYDEGFAEPVIVTGKGYGVSNISRNDLSTIPEDFMLGNNYPNPFNPLTNIKFGVPEKSIVKLQVFDITGRLVNTLAEGIYEPGSYEVHFNAEAYSSGVYIYTVEAVGLMNGETFRESQKMILLK